MKSSEFSRIILVRAGLIAAGFKPFLTDLEIAERGLKTCVEVAEAQERAGLLTHLFCVQ